MHLAFTIKIVAGPATNPTTVESNNGGGNGHLWTAPPIAQLRTRLLLLIILAVTPALALVLYGNFEQRRIEKEGARREAMAISALAAESQAHFVNNTKKLLSTLEHYPFLLLASNRDFAEAAFFNLRNLSPDYQNFGLVEANGKLFASAQRTNDGVDLSDRSYI